MPRLFRFILAWFLVAFFAGLTYALASGNTHPISGAGDGAAPISGWIIYDVRYQLGSDPSKIEAVSFTLDRPAGTVWVKLAAGEAGYHTCAGIGANRWQCDLVPGLAISSADQLRVVAIGN